MANRDMALAVSGVLVGVLLGAGSILYGQDSSLSAQLSSDDVLSYYGESVDSPRFMQKRRAVRRAKSRPPLSGTQMVSPRSAAPEVPSAVSAVEANVCALINAVISELREDVLYALPSRRETLELVTSVEAVFDDSFIDCSMAGMMEEEEHEAAPVRQVVPECMDPDYCYMYSGTRRTHCIVEQARGICYAPRQTKW